MKAGTAQSRKLKARLTEREAEALFRALRRVKELARTRCTAWALELLLMDYTAGPGPLPPLPERRGRRTTHRFGLYPDQVRPARAALRRAREALGTDDDGEALAAIARAYLRFQKGGGDFPAGPAPIQRNRAGTPQGGGPDRPDTPTETQERRRIHPPSSMCESTWLALSRGVGSSTTSPLSPPVDGWPGAPGAARSELPTGDPPGRDAAGASLSTVARLANALGFPEAELRELAGEADGLYSHRRRPKRSGGTRRITAPAPRLKAVQAGIKALLKPVARSPIDYCGRSGGPAAAARRHARARWVAGLDIRDFHPSIRADLVHRRLSELGCDDDAAGLLTRLLTHQGRLAQGSPASAAVATLVLAPFDASGLDLARAHGVTLTRYSDNFYASGPDRRAVERVVAALRRELASLALRIHGPSVTRGSQAKIHGFRVRAGVALPGSYRQAVRSAVRRFARYGGSEADRRRLTGQIARIGVVHPREAAQLRESLDGPFASAGAPSPGRRGEAAGHAGAPARRDDPGRS